MQAARVRAGFSMAQHQVAAGGTFQARWKAEGRDLVLRPVCPQDVRLSLAFIEGLSFSSRYFRFGRGDVRFAEKEMLQLCSPDPRECADFIVLDVTDPVPVELASARYCIQPGTRSAEFALAVADEWHGRGLGRRLLEALLASARGHALEEIYGIILATNCRMLAFVQHQGFECTESLAGGVLMRVVRRIEQGEVVQRGQRQTASTGAAIR